MLLFFQLLVMCALFPKLDQRGGGRLITHASVERERVKRPRNSPPAPRTSPFAFVGGGGSGNDGKCGVRRQQSDEGPTDESSSIQPPQLFQGRYYLQNVAFFPFLFFLRILPHFYFSSHLPSILLSFSFYNLFFSSRFFILSLYVCALFLSFFFIIFLVFLYLSFLLLPFLTHNSFPTFTKEREKTLAQFVNKITIFQTQNVFFSFSYLDMVLIACRRKKGYYFV